MRKVVCWNNTCKCFNSNFLFRKQESCISYIISLFLIKNTCESKFFCTFSVSTKTSNWARRASIQRSKKAKLLSVWNIVSWLLYVALLIQSVCCGRSLI